MFPQRDVCTGAAIGKWLKIRILARARCPFLGRGSAGAEREGPEHRSGYTGSVDLSIELDREDDGRWIAEALELPGVMTYGSTREEAISNTEKLAIEVIADRITHGELPHSALSVSFRVREQLAGD